MKGSLSPWRQHPGPAAARLDITVPDQEDPPESEYVRWLAQLQADLAESLGGVALRAARPVAIGSAPGGSTRPLSSAGRIVGWSVRETSGGAAAAVRLWDGREGGGQLLATISVPAAGCNVVMPTGGGISVSDALFVEVVSGALEGVVYLGAVD